MIVAIVRCVLAALCLALVAPSIAAQDAVFANGFEARAAVVINEIESFDDMGAADWIEFHNQSSRSVDLTGWFFTDNDPFNVFVFPDGTVMEPGDYLVIDSMPFALGSVDEVVLYSPQLDVDAYSWTSHAVTTYGRCPNGSGAIALMAEPTRGAANSCL